MKNDRPNSFRLCVFGAFALSLAGVASACGSQAKTGLSGSGSTTAGGSFSAGNTGKGGGATAGATTTISGGTSDSGTAGTTGSGGSQNTCPSSCVLTCQEDPPCNCDCPNAGGAGGGSTATGGHGGATGTGGATSSGTGISCYDSSGAIASTAKTCTLASDCKQVVQPTCCGGISEVGLAKSSPCTFPKLSCGNLGCANFTYQLAEDGKNTAEGGSIGLQCVSGQCKTFVVPKGVDAGADAGRCPVGQNWCPGCTPGAGICLAVCGAVACPPPDAGTGDGPSSSCAEVKTQAECDRRSDCHSVFLPGTTCECFTAGCCQLFNRCAEGGRANCTGPVACLAPQPVCVAPYALSYTNVCFEGCVLQSECAVAATTCPSTPPTNGSSCGSSNMSCFYDNCPETGRTQATCAGGKWAVQTAACGTVRCTGAPTSLTCPSGKMCLVTVSGAVGAQCVDNSCGEGPVTSHCGTSLGECSVNATLTSGVTIVCNTCPAGQTCAH